MKVFDRSQFIPAVASGVAAVAVLAHYYVRYHTHGPLASASVPSGGSLFGLAYGLAGWLIIVFGVSLSLKRKKPNLRIGSGKAWLTFHVWLSLLCVPIVYVHAAFAMRGVLAGLVAILFGIVILSGIYGLTLQQFLPSRMREDILRETVLDEIPSMLYQLALEACMKVRAAVLAEGWDGPVPEALERPVPPGSEAPKTSPAGGSEVQFRPGTKPLVDFYAHDIRPFLEGKKSSGLESAQSRKHCFNHLRSMVPEDVYETVEDLESICRERADLAKQQKLHRMLHAWLYVHVPISVMLLVAVTVHAIMAIRFVGLPF